MADSNFFDAHAGGHDPEIWIIQGAALQKGRWVFWLGLVVFAVASVGVWWSWARGGLPLPIATAFSASLGLGMVAFAGFAFLHAQLVIDRRAGRMVRSYRIPGKRWDREFAISDLRRIEIVHLPPDEDGGRSAFYLALRFPGSGSISLQLFGKFPTTTAARAAAEPLAEFLGVELSEDGSLVR